MTPITVRHRTAYRYRRPVDLWAHRLLLCPCESRDLQVASCAVTASPKAQVARTRRGAELFRRFPDSTGCDDHRRRTALTS
jgi:Bacterial transglutaminase-like N-terminal region